MIFFICLFLSERIQVDPEATVVASTLEAAVGELLRASLDAQVTI